MDENVKSKNKKLKVVVAVVLLLIGLRLIITDIIHKELNKYLAGFSESYKLHVENLSLSFLRGAYRLEGFTGELKKNQEQFLDTKSVDISIAWRDIFQGRFQTDIVIDGFKFVLGKNLLDETKKRTADAANEAQEAGAKVFPVQISRVDIRNSSVQFADIEGLPEELRVRLDEINGHLHNVTATEKKPVSDLLLNAKLQGVSELKIKGELDQVQVPNEWHALAELTKVDLTKFNEMLRRQVPLTFTQGHVDIYAEAKGENNNVVGYFKPFLKDVELIGNKNDFKGFKQFSLESVTVVGNFLLKENSSKTVASKVYFAWEDKSFDWSITQALTKAIQHGFREKIEPGVENEFQMKGVKAKRP